MPYVYEIEDGYDTIDWIASSPWSNVVVGAWGDSYYGWTQWAAVGPGILLWPLDVLWMPPVRFRVYRWFAERHTHTNGA